MSFDLPPDDSDDLPDWLQGVDEPGDAASSPDHADDQDLPDWISGTGALGAPASSDHAEDGDTPDWLSPIQEAESAEQPDFGFDDGGNEDWLDTIRDQHAKDSGSLNLPDESDSGDFMEKIQAMQAEDSGEESSGGDDWLSGLGGADEDSGEQDSSGDWLSGIQEPEDTISGAPLEEVAAAAKDDSVPDWMSEDTSDGGSLDWLSGGGEDSSSDLFGDLAPASAEASTDDSSDWLSESGEDSGSDLFGDLAPASADDTPDWMADSTGDPGVDLFSEPAPTSEEPATDEVPDWLAEGGSDFGDETSGDFVPTSEESPTGDAPDWLAEGGQGEFNSEGFDEPQPAAEGNVPDWLAQSSSDEYGSQNLFEEDDTEIGADSPDWLQTLKASAEEKSTPPATIDEKEASSIEVPDFVAEQTGALPDWLGDMQDASPDIEIQGDMPAFAGDISGQPMSAEDVYTTPEAATDFGEVISPFTDDEVASADLEPAELPSWLQAMRPTEAIDETSETPGFATGAIEGAGPLQGLAGILPAEPDIVHFGDAPIPNTNLAITQAQQSHVAILQRLISQEQAARPSSRRPLAIPQTLLRMVVAFLLYLVVALPGLTGPFATAPNINNAPAYTDSAVETINNLPSGGVVLLAFDYPPGLSGELEAASAGVIQHLNTKGMKLAVISTIPTGPATADHFFKKLYPVSEIDPGLQYTNLGFVSGDSAALRKIATDIRSTIPLSVPVVPENPDPNQPAPPGEETSLWLQPPLDTILTMDDFALVVVLTQDPDTARAWVEQVEPSIPNTPMIMAISAQAEPILRTYYRTGQVEGIISGARGGAIYENQPGNSSSIAMSHWTGYSLGMTLSILMIAIGSLINLVRAFFNRNKNKRAEGVR